VLLHTRSAVVVVLVLWLAWSALTLKPDALAAVDPIGFYTVALHGLIPALLVPVALVVVRSSRSIAVALLAVAFALPLLFGFSVALLDGWADGSEMWFNAQPFLFTFGALFAFEFWAARAMHRRLWAS
jgi:hypothetical protein